MRAPPDDELQVLRGRVAASPSDLRLRFELGTALCQHHDYLSAMPELQKALGHPEFRRRAGELLAQAFDARGMPESASTMRRLVSEDPPDEGGSAPIPVPSAPRPPRRPGASASEEILHDPNNG